MGSGDPLAEDELAEAANELLEKGQQVCVEAALRRLPGQAAGGMQTPRIWTGNDGESRAPTS